MHSNHLIKDRGKTMSPVERARKVEIGFAAFQLIGNTLAAPIKVAQNNFQHFLRRWFLWVIITTLYQLMLQSWYQKTAQSLVNTLVLFS